MPTIEPRDRLIVALDVPSVADAESMVALKDLMASLGSPCLGDPVYGAGAPAAPVREAMREAGLTRQALHAAVLGFRHPITGEMLRFETPLPQDMAALEAALRAI